MFQVNTVNARRYYTCGFNLTAEAADSLRFTKENGSEYPIRYIEAAFNDETLGFELFVEFEEQIKSTVFMSHLKVVAAGMDPISFSTTHDKAAVALVRVRQMAIKTGKGYTRGQPTQTLVNATHAYLATTGAAGAGAGAAAPSMEIEHMSKQLGRVEDVVGQTRDVASEARAAAEEAASNSNEVAIKVGSIDGKIDSMKFLEEENASLKEKLAHKTKEVDRIENVQGQQTKRANTLQTLYDASKAKVIKVTATASAINQDLAETRGHMNTLLELLAETRKTMAESRKTNTLLREMLETRKRRRGADSDDEVVVENDVDIEEEEEVIVEGSDDN